MNNLELSKMHDWPKASEGVADKMGYLVCLM